MILLDGVTFPDADAVAAWLRRGELAAPRRDRDLGDVLAEAEAHPEIDAALAAILDDGPPEARAALLQPLRAYRGGGATLRGALIRASRAPWLADLSPSGQPLGLSLSQTAQHLAGDHADVIRAFLALGEAFGAARDWSWMALYAWGDDAALDALDAALRGGMPVSAAEATSIARALRDPSLVPRAAQILGRQPDEVQEAFRAAAAARFPADLTDRPARS
jgi:hypothetical protein